MAIASPLQPLDLLWDLLFLGFYCCLLFAAAPEDSRKRRAGIRDRKGRPDHQGLQGHQGHQVSGDNQDRRESKVILDRLDLRGRQEHVVIMDRQG